MYGLRRLWRSASIARMRGRHSMRPRSAVNETRIRFGVRASVPGTRMGVGRNAKLPFLIVLDSIPGQLADGVPDVATADCPALNAPPPAGSPPRRRSRRHAPLPRSGSHVGGNEVVR